MWLVFALLGNQSEWYCIPNVVPFWNLVPFKNAQLVPKLASTGNKLILITAACALAPKKCMRRTLTLNKLLTPSEYRSTDRIG